MTAETPGEGILPSIQSSADVCLQLPELMQTLRAHGYVDENTTVDDVRLNRDGVRDVLREELAGYKDGDPGFKAAKFGIEAIDKASLREEFYRRELEHPHKVHEGPINENVFKLLAEIENEDLKEVAVAQLAEILFKGSRDAKGRLGKLQFKKPNVKTGHRQFAKVYEDNADVFEELCRIAIEEGREDIIEVLDDRTSLVRKVRYLRKLYDMAVVCPDGIFESFFSYILGDEEGSKVRAYLEKAGSTVADRVFELDEIWRALQDETRFCSISPAQKILEVLEKITEEVLDETVSGLPSTDFANRKKNLECVVQRSKGLTMERVDHLGGCDQGMDDQDFPPPGVRMVNRKAGYELNDEIVEHLSEITDLNERMAEFVKIALGIEVDLCAVGIGEQLFKRVFGDTDGGMLKDTLDVAENFDARLAIMEKADEILKPLQSGAASAVSVFTDYILDGFEYYVQGIHSTARMSYIMFAIDKLTGFGVAAPVRFDVLKFIESVCPGELVSRLESSGGVKEGIDRLFELSSNPNPLNDHTLIDLLNASLGSCVDSLKRTLFDKLTALRDLVPQPPDVQEWSLVDQEQFARKKALVSAVLAAEELKVVQGNEEEFFRGRGETVAEKRAYLDGFEFVYENAMLSSAKRHLTSYIEGLEESEREGISF